MHFLLYLAEMRRNNWAYNGIFSKKTRELCFFLRLMACLCSFFVVVLVIVVSLSMAIYHKCQLPLVRRLDTHRSAEKPQTIQLLLQVHRHYYICINNNFRSFFSTSRISMLYHTYIYMYTKLWINKSTNKNETSKNVYVHNITLDMCAMHTHIYLYTFK